MKEFSDIAECKEYVNIFGTNNLIVEGLFYRAKSYYIVYCIPSNDHMRLKKNSDIIKFLLQYDTRFENYGSTHFINNRINILNAKN